MAKEKKVVEPITTRDVVVALGARYQDAKWVNIPECPFNGRYCDWFSYGVWNSTGGNIIGHEIKVSRSDWLREIQDPNKAEACAKYCTHWYIVAPRGLIKPEELHAEWGLMELSSGKLKISRPAVRKKPQVIEGRLLGEIMRRLQKNSRDDSLIEARAVELADFKIRSVTHQLEWRAKNADKQLQALHALVDEFEAKSGLKIDRWDGSRMAEAVAVMERLRDSSIVSDLDYTADKFQRAAMQMRTAAMQIRQQTKEIEREKRNTARHSH